MSRRNPERWRALEARLSRETDIWLATVRKDGRPHLVPVWYIWLEGKLYISTGSDTQKFVNMYNNQNIALALPDAQAVILIEGEAHTAGRGIRDSLAEHFVNKYGWDFRLDDSADWRLIEVTPFKVLSWGDGYDETEGTRVV